MKDISIEIVTDGNIEQCRTLCDELMVFQKSKATIAPEKFDMMNFDSRMKKSYENAIEKQLIVIKDHDTPIGYVFSTIEKIPQDKQAYPEWAPISDDKNIQGFYPSWDNFPSKIGCLNNLYLSEGYRDRGLGSQLFKMAIQWLESFADVSVTFVYISNGNDAALNFYLNHGFTFSHSVFGGFINAVYKRKETLQRL